QLTAVADEKYGQAMVLLYEGDVSAAYVAERCRSVLSRYELPKHFLKVQSLPLTETGKPARREARKMAEELLLK
ncbi:MAG: o-succinylbenzoic acid (OSB) synthetase, partial [Bacteroidaceae bacterium]|nr:o-succinylbenzoic acid (OSB) synthetase [Bacteroidaceae bacterium]